MSHPVVLITGALTGIGRATALAFAQQGARVVVSGRRDDVGEALVAALRALGAEAEFIRADVRHESDVQNLIDGTVARFGRLDVAVNNAGTEGQLGPITEQSCHFSRLKDFAGVRGGFCVWFPLLGGTTWIRSFFATAPVI
jgi:NAD(P)-dependent dehydrogenase (short-subunit alcohol dehydrogenase family)